MPALRRPHLRNDATARRLRRALIAYWRLDEASGVRRDVGASRLHWTDNNTVTSEAGKFRTRAVFAEANTEYLSLAGGAADPLQFDGTQPFSVSFWLGYDDAATFGMPLSALPASFNSGWEVQQNVGSARFHAQVESGATKYLLHSHAGAYNDGTVRHFVWCYDGSLAVSGVVLYVNGASISLTNESVGTVTGASGAGVGVQMGARNATNPLNGSMDEVAIFSRVITPREVGYLYNRGAGRRVA